ncbi:unnamed protein product [Boreogadus saida]
MKFKVETVKWAWPSARNGFGFFVYLKMLLSLEGAASNEVLLPLWLYSTVSLPSDAGDEDTAVAVETTTKSSDQRQSSQEVEDGGKGGRASVSITTRGVERYQPSKAEVGEPNKDNDCFGSGRLCNFRQP